MQTIEKDIARKTVDNSAGVCKEVVKALVDAVKSLAKKKPKHQFLKMSLQKQKIALKVKL